MLIAGPGTRLGLRLSVPGDSDSKSALSGTRRDRDRDPGGETLAFKSRLSHGSSWFGLGLGACPAVSPGKPAAGSPSGQVRPLNDRNSGSTSL